jgi:hypothetical protein
MTIESLLKLRAYGLLHLTSVPSDTPAKLRTSRDRWAERGRMRTRIRSGDE